MNILLLLVGGGMGALLRFVVDGHVRTNSRREFPWGTILINASGSLLLGLITGLALAHHASTNARLIVGTGFCGGYTTFSTASFETVRLIEERRIFHALLQCLGNLFLSLGFAALGLWLA
jgi:fluoride exporter